MEEDTVHVQSTYKSLNSDLVKSIQAMKSNIYEYKIAINNLNETLFFERSRSLKEKNQMKAAFGKFMKSMCKKTLDFIEAFDVNNPETESQPTEIEAENNVGRLLGKS